MNAAQMLNFFDWDAIVNAMDEDIRELVHMELAPTTDIEFLERYMELHKERYGQDFEIN